MLKTPGETFGAHNKTKRRRVKRIVMTMSNDISSLEVHNLNSELEEFVPPMAADGGQLMDGDDDMTDDDDNDEAPCDDTVIVRGVPEHGGVVRRNLAQKRANRKKD